MGVEALVADWNRRGIWLEPRRDGATLAVRPSQLLTDADRAAIRANKPRLLAYLAARPITPAESIIATCQRFSIACGAAALGQISSGRFARAPAS
jgi:hypothetical protein